MRRRSRAACCVSIRAARRSRPMAIASGNAVASSKRIDVFQRIHHQQSGHSIRKHVAKIVDDVRRFLWLGKEHERQKTGDDGAKHRHQYSDDALPCGHDHDRTSPTSLRSAADSTTISIITFPNIIRFQIIQIRTQHNEHHQHGNQRRDHEIVSTESAPCKSPAPQCPSTPPYGFCVSLSTIDPRK